MASPFNPQHVRFFLFIAVVTVLLVVLLLAMPMIWTVLRIFMLAWLLAVALNGIVGWQVRLGTPRWLAALNLMLFLILVALIMLFYLLPPLIAQGQSFAAGLPAAWTTIVNRTSALLQHYTWLPQIDVQALRNLLLGPISLINTARTVVTSLFGLITAGILILVATFYTLANPWSILYGIRGLFPTAWWGTLERIACAIAERIRAWVLGTFVLAIIVGVLDFLVLTLINLVLPENLPFVFFFAILGAVLEVLPIVGPIIATVLPTLVGLSISIPLGLSVLVGFTIIQQTEGHLLVPLVMGRALRLHPVSMLFALTVMTALFGIFGAIISMPVVATIKVIYDEWYYPFMHEGHQPESPPEEPTTPAEGD